MLLQKFDIALTNASKGTALMLILWHHLFYEKPEMGFWVFQSALLAKVCVAIYVVLSGYGLAESVKRNKLRLFSFYKKRFIKLYTSYWLIALIFIPIGILFMGRTLETVFGEHAYFKLFIQMTGIHMFTDVGYGYNATWWFMSLFVILYAIFPLVFGLTQKFPIFILGISVAILFVPIPIVNEWILPFVVGIFLSQNDGFVKIFAWLGEQGMRRFLTLFILTALIVWYRAVFNNVRLDSLFAILLIIWTTKLVLVSNMARKMLGFIGVHSLNIILFHTFIYGYYFSYFIYAFKNPLLIFIVLLGASLVISMGIENLKKIISSCWKCLKNLRKSNTSENLYNKIN